MPIRISPSPISIVLEEDIVPSDFYHTGDNRYVFRDFAEWIAKGLPVLEAGTAFTLVSVDVSGDPTQKAAAIEPLLPLKHIVEPLVVCAIGTAGVRLQPKGEPGIWDTEGANLLFTAACVVWICWDPGNNKWTFSTWPRNGDSFRPIRRVFFLAH